MPVFNADGFYLGTIADLDPDEGNWNTENANALVGQTVGTQANPLAGRIEQIGLNDSNSDGIIRENDQGGTAEQVIYNGTSRGLDSATDYFVTVTYTNGSTATTSMEVLQDVSGRVFLVPFKQGSPENDVLNDFPIRSIRFDGVRGSNFAGTVADPEPNAFVACFAEGTEILADGGYRCVETLAPGDLVQTMDHGLQRLRWITSTPIAETTRSTAPVVISPGALGHGMPQTPLRVSPQHRLLICSPIAARLFGSAQVLVAAVKLVGLPGIGRDAEGKQLTYFHLLFDAHEIVDAQGVFAESLLLHSMALRSMDATPLRRLIVRQLGSDRTISPARTIAHGRKTKALTARHAKHRKALFG